MTAQIDAFSTAWERFFREVRRSRARLLADAPGPLTMAQWLLVEPLHDGTPQGVGALATHAGVAPPTATRMLDGLVAQGLVERRAGADDRRRVEITLTAEGREAVAARREIVEAARRRIFEALEPDEREAAERLLRRLTEIIEAGAVVAAP